MHPLLFIWAYPTRISHCITFCNASYCYSTLYSKYSVIENFSQDPKGDQYILIIFCSLKHKPDGDKFKITLSDYRVLIPP